MFIVHELYTPLHSHPVAEAMATASGHSLTLLQLETVYLQSFDFSRIYNYKRDAVGIHGYKHTPEARAKMRERFVTTQC